MDLYIFIDDQLNVVDIYAESEAEALFDVERVTGRSACDFSFITTP